MRILVVEDEPRMARLIRQGLEEGAQFDNLEFMFYIDRRISVFYNTGYGTVVRIA